MRMTLDRDLQVPMRDGVILSTNVYLPDRPGLLPTVVQRSPYSKDAPMPGAPLDAMRFVRAGYAFVLQDVRGRFLSGGQFTPFMNEIADGEDTIRWAASQPWSNGKVAMVGGSYNGATQLLAASAAPSSLVTIAPRMTSSDYYQGWTYRGGAFELGFVLFWTLHSLLLADLEFRAGSGSHLDGEIAEVIEAIDALDHRTYRHLTPRQSELLAEFAPYYGDWLDHPSYDPFWRDIAPHEVYERMEVPALHVGGWYDIFLEGTVANFVGMQQASLKRGLASGQRLVVGPWSHAVTGGIFHDQSFGTRSGFDALDVTGLHLRWYDHWLKERSPAIDEEKPVKIFVMGDNRWFDESSWPLPGTVFRPYYLAGEGSANTMNGGGRLTVDAPAGRNGLDVFAYNPLIPVPTIGGGTLLAGQNIGANAGPRDQRSLAGRDDILYYVTDALERRLEVTGPLAARLFVSSSALDTDFTAKVIDIHPSGYAALLAEGVLRMRYRESFNQSRLLEPNRIYEIQISLGATAHAFLPGHRLCLAISSSNFPRFDRNTNTGGDISREKEGDMTVAHNSVHRDALHPSNLLLPIVERF